MCYFLSIIVKDECQIVFKLYSAVTDIGPRAVVQPASF